MKFWLAEKLPGSAKVFRPNLLSSKLQYCGETGNEFRRIIKLNQRNSPTFRRQEHGLLIPASFLRKLIEFYVFCKNTEYSYSILYILLGDLIFCKYFIYSVSLWDILAVSQMFWQFEVPFGQF
jgi:hypothetical protein